MSFASKPGAPRLVGTQTGGGMVDPRLLRASFNGMEFPVARVAPRSTESIAQPTPTQPKTK
jgi:hypothetical protein